MYIAVRVSLAFFTQIGKAMSDSESDDFCMKEYGQEDNIMGPRYTCFKHVCVTIADNGVEIRATNL